MSRSFSALALYCLLALTMGTASPLASSARAQVVPGAEVDLRETLEKGLKVRIDRERRFLDSVLDLVKREVFRRELVLTIYQKARNRHRSYPFVYFRTMMTFIAEKRGVELLY